MINQLTLPLYARLPFGFRRRSACLNLKTGRSDQLKGVFAGRGDCHDELISHEGTPQP